MYSGELRSFFLNVLGLTSRELRLLDVAVGADVGVVVRYDTGDH